MRVSPGLDDVEVRSVLERGCAPPALALSVRRGRDRGACDSSPPWTITTSPRSTTSKRDRRQIARWTPSPPSPRDHTSASTPNGDLQGVHAAAWSCAQRREATRPSSRSRAASAREPPRPGLRRRCSCARRSRARPRPGRRRVRERTPAPAPRTRPPWAPTPGSRNAACGISSRSDSSRSGRGRADDGADVRQPGAADAGRAELGDEPGQPLADGAAVRELAVLHVGGARVRRAHEHEQPGAARPGGVDERRQRIARRAAG